MKMNMKVITNYGKLSKPRTAREIGRGAGKVHTYMDTDTKTIIDDEKSLKPRKARDIGGEAGNKCHPVCMSKINDGSSLKPRNAREIGREAEQKCHPVSPKYMMENH